MTAANKMKTLLECGNVIKGFVYHQDEQREELWFDGTPENIASFIALRSCAHHMILTDRLDNFILSTINRFPVCRTIEVRQSDYHSFAGVLEDA